MTFPRLVAQSVKNPPANAGDLGYIPGLGKSSGGGHGQRSLAGCSPWGRKESGTTERLSTKLLLLLLSHFSRVRLCVTP